MSYNEIEIPTTDSSEAWITYIQALHGDEYTRERKKASYRLVKFYQGHQREETEKLIKSRKIQNQLRTLPVWTKNLLKYGIDLLAKTYDGMVERSIADDTESEQLNFVTKNYTKTFSKVSKYIIPERMALIQTVLEDEELKYKCYYQYQYDLVYSDGVLIAVILSDYKQDWTKTNYYVYTVNYTYHVYGNKIISQIPNEIGILPFTVIYSEDPGFNTYLEPHGEWSDQQIELNAIYSSNLLCYTMQSHAILWERRIPDSVVGEADEGVIQTPGIQLPLPGASEALILFEDEEGRKEEVGYLTPGVNFADLNSVLTEYSLSFLEDLGIPRDIVTISITGATLKPATTGYLAERKLNDLNMPYRQLFAEAEKEVFAKAVELLKASGISGYNQVNPNDYAVSFSSQPRRLDTLEIPELVQLYQLDKRILDEADLLRIIKGITRQEALKEIENKSDLNRNEGDIANQQGDEEWNLMKTPQQ